MTPNPISARLRSCQNLVNAQRSVLEEAMLFALEHDYSQDWIDAIQKALDDNDAQWLHIGNVATLIEIAAPPLPLKEA